MCTEMLREPRETVDTPRDKEKASQRSCHLKWGWKDEENLPGKEISKEDSRPKCVDMRNYSHRYKNSDQFKSDL